ncbi:hypothetical protein MTX78_01025 [Hymenobacter tibetensis]|uniref:Uncharacterized protein n=1 Tax=Hymenobacter tibetensis TaxID=497967 RepID=A0ABY4CYR0_9BACT|nr:hypothetical protein [Hymenobacter tibetensis]UOG75196.1 hypothetical protein MTX78_01025 [Hymenobacter tibetensis]
MVTKFLMYKALLSAVLCLGVSRLSVAQRPAPELPLTPVQPRVQLPATVAEILAKRKDVAGASTPPATVTRVAMPQAQPLYLLNSEIIIAPDLSGLQPSGIKAITLYKGQDAPTAQWLGLVTHGIVDVEPKQKFKIKSRSLSDVGKTLDVQGPVRYTINAMPVADANLLIALDAIGEIKITRATPETPTTTVAISIRPPKPSPPPPPGTIYIRGLAAH